MFNNLPFNTKQQFVMATDPGGCEIYIPVDTVDLDEQLLMRDKLKQYVNDNYIEPELLLA